MENLGCEIIEGNGSMNGADQASCSDGGNEAAIRSAEEEEDNDDEEEEEEGEELRLKKLGDLIGPENLKALLDAEGGGRRNAAYYHSSPPNWRRRRRRRRKAKDSNSDKSHDQQQPDDLPLGTAKEEKQQEKSRNGVNGTGEDNVVPRKLPETAKYDKQKAKSRNGVVENGEDNVVLRKLLRRPRYFDPPMDDGLEELCPLCGQDGHVARHCVLQKNQKKPCFLCGSSEHAWKHCKKSLCKREGYHSEEKDELSSVICLNCRETGHDMLSCKSDYAPDDLKGIECYVCKKDGHLCCSEFPDNNGLLLEVTCYSCGESGHSGSGCTNESSVKKQKPYFRKWNRRKRVKFS